MTHPNITTTTDNTNQMNQMDPPTKYNQQPLQTSPTNLLIAYKPKRQQLHQKCPTRRKEIHAKRRIQKQHEILTQKGIHNIVNSTIINTTKQLQSQFSFIINPHLPLHQNVKQIFYTFNQQLLTKQPSNLTFHVLCTHMPPPPHTHKLLGLGLKYWIQTKIHKPKIHNTVSNIIWSIWTQAFLTDNNIENNDNYILQLYLTNKKWMPPPANGTTKHHLFEFVRWLETAIQQHKHYPWNNLTLDQTTALCSLKNNPNYKIINTVKNLGPAILNHSDYINKALTEHLLTDTYELIPEQEAAPKIKHNESLLKQLFQWHKHTLSKPEIKFFDHSFWLHHRVPIFYTMPKIHKNPYTTHPVVSCINSFNAIFSTWLDFQMKCLLPFIPSYLKNSSMLINDIKKN